MKIDNQLVDLHGRLLVPLYHGTGSAHKESILTHGLGGARDNKLFDTCLLKRITVALSDAERQGRSAFWSENSPVLEAMLDGAVGAGGLNFRYGGLYLTSSRPHAVTYAREYPLGEYLTHLTCAYKELCRVEPALAQSIIDEHQSLHKLLRSESHPLVIVVDQLPVRDLRTEAGEPLELMFKELEALQKDQTDFCIGQLLSEEEFGFEYLSTVPPESIKITEVSPLEKGHADF